MTKQSKGLRKSSSQMKNCFRFSLVGLWGILATGFVTRLWLTHPDAVPRFPESFWLRLINLYGSQNGEVLADLELLIALILSSVVVSLFTLFGWFLWHRIQKSLANH